MVKKTKKKVKKNKTLKNQQKKKSEQSPCVLIVDDDVDSIMPIASLFQQLGCNTICVTDFDEAVKSISSREADIIILDWFLGEKKNGGDVIKDSIKNLSQKKKNLEPALSYLKSLTPKVITYSSLDKNKISLIKNKIFQHIDHWQKPLEFSKLLIKMKELI